MRKIPAIVADLVPVVFAEKTVLPFPGDRVKIFLQIAFRGPKGPWYDPELQRSFEQRELYAHLIRAGKKVNESTFRTYLRRLREKNLIWKHNGRWRLAKNGRAEVEQKDLEVKPEE